MTDSELIHKFNSGDKSAFDELYNKYSANAVRTAYLITHDRTLSDDIVQEAFIKCCMGLGGLKNPEFFKSWFFKILVRTAWKMERENKDVPVEEIFDKAETAIDAKERDTDFDLLYEAINSLSIKQRTVIVLFYFNDMPLKEIAKATGSVVPTVKSQLFLARRTIKKYMESIDDKNGVTANEV